jgi:hypothetical protein
MRFSTGENQVSCDNPDDAGKAVLSPCRLCSNLTDLQETPELYAVHPFQVSDVIILQSFPIEKQSFAKTGSRQTYWKRLKNGRKTAFQVITAGRAHASSRTAQAARPTLAAAAVAERTAATGEGTAPVATVPPTQQQLELKTAVRKTASFFEFSLCLSRACLGKMIVFICKWRENAVFRRCEATMPRL